MIMHNNDLVEYSSASAMADLYERETANIRRLLLELGEAQSRLIKTFCDNGGHDYDFRLQAHYQSRDYKLEAVDVNKIIASFKRAAWKSLVAKLDIRKVMSKSAQDKLDSQLEGCQRFSNEQIPELPDITGENILAVLTDMIGRAGDFLEDKIREEYEFWKPHRIKHKTDNPNVLAEKVIRGYMVEFSGWSRAWDAKYSQRGHLHALDSIFHLLDGQGIAPEHDGDLITAIRASGPDGKGESRYFKFACFHNGNLHLRFKRLDLLAEFNRVAGGASIGQKREHSRGTTAV